MGLLFSICITFASSDTVWEGRGYIALSAVSLADAVSCYNYQVVGRAETCRIRFYAITGKRMIEHPAVRQMTQDARAIFHG